MKGITKSILTLIAGVVLAGGAWSMSAVHAKALASTVSAQASNPATLSASGKIAAVNADSFTVEVASGNDTQAIMFSIDSKSAVDGKLEVGGTADVTYKKVDGKNIVISVRVTPPSNQ
jgi:hypothetical protein